MNSNKYPCLICSEGTANNNTHVDKIDHSDVTFILRILLEVPQNKLSDQNICHLLTTSSKTSSLSDNGLKICDQCFAAVQLAEQIYSEILAATQKFRTIQKKVVEGLRQSLKAQKDNITLPKPLGAFPFQLCRTFAYDHNFNNFGHPFTIQSLSYSPLPSTHIIQHANDEVTFSGSSHVALSTLSSSDYPGDSGYKPSTSASLEPPPLKKLRCNEPEIRRKSPTRLRQRCQFPGPRPMTRALFLNIAAVTDHQRISKLFDPLLPPYVILGKVPVEELPNFMSFPHGMDRNSDLLRLVNGHKVDFQNKVMTFSKDILLETRKIEYDNSEDGHLPEGRIYYMTDLSKKEEMDAVGPAFQAWKAVGGVLSWLHPELNCIANVGFIFSQKNGCLGLHLEDLRFASVNILFQGRKQWDIVDPRDNEELIADLKNLHRDLRMEKEDQSGEHDCELWVLHKNIWIGEETKKRWRVSTFVQERGEVVVVPPGVLHQVRSLENCVAASYNFVDCDWVEIGKEKGKIFECCCCSHGGKQVLGRMEVERLMEAHGQVKVYADYQKGEEGETKKYCGRATAEFFDKVGLQDLELEGGSSEVVANSQGSSTTEEFDPTWSEPSEQEGDEGGEL